MHGEPPVLSYPGPLVQMGVTESRHGDAVIVTLPQRGFLSFVAVSGRSIAIWIAGVMLAMQLLSIPGMSQVVFAGAVALAAIVIGLFLTFRSKPIEIEIGPETVFVRNLAPPGEQELNPVLTRPRDAVYGLYYREFAKAIFLRAHGHEMIEIPLNYPKTSMQAVVELLRGHLKLGSWDEADSDAR